MAKSLKTKDGYLGITYKVIGKAANTMQTMAMKKQGLKPGVVEVWEDGYRTSGEKNAFEWWYYDFQFDDGSACVVVYFTKPNLKPKIPLKPAVLLMYRSPDGERKRDWAFCKVDEFSASEECCDVKMGRNWTKGDLAHYELYADVAGVTCDLSIERKADSWRPDAGMGFVDPFQKKYFAWVVAVPYGIVEGKITVEGKTRNVSGIVYHDHNWGGMLIAGVFDHWYWGRGRIGDYRFVFVQMTTNSFFGLGAVKVPIFFLSKGDKVLIGGVENGLPMRLKASEFVDGPGGRKYPTNLDLNWKTKQGEVGIAIRNPKVVGDIDMTGSIDDDAWFRKLPMRLIASSYHIDFDAECELKIDMDGISETVRGHAIFEQMLLHRKQHG